MKTCRKCGVKKDISEFYKHNQMADGYLNICKDCVKVRVHNYYCTDIENSRKKEHLRYKRRKNDPKYRESLKRSTRKYRAKLKSNGVLYNKIYKNRPDRCSACQIITQKLHAHHPDYSKPLEVIWLCVPCHCRLHNESKVVLKGET